MVDDVHDYLTGRTVGIIGCGHIGRTLAERIVDRGFPRESLKVSHGGTATTLEKIRSLGLEECISGNRDICQNSDIIFISVRPQSFKALKGLPFDSRSQVVSCMAGVSRASLKNALGVDVHRIMPSGPDTIKGEMGIVALYPYSDLLASVLTHMGLRVYELDNEEMMHHFTVGVCLPAALLATGIGDTCIRPAIDALEDEYPAFREIYGWAEDVIPVLSSDQEKDEYISRMCTKGGVTEAIISSLRCGSSFLEALRSGVARSRELQA